MGTPAPVPNVPPARQSTEPQLPVSAQQNVQDASPRLLAGAMGETQIAAEEGKSEAQLQMGRLYLEGRLVPRDRVTAYFWFNVAAASGGETASEAAKERDHLEKLLTPGQVAQAEDMSRGWKPKGVLEGPLMRVEFVKELQSQLSLSKDGFKSELKNLIDHDAAIGDTWLTAVRFPGSGSKTCEVNIPDDKEVASLNETIRNLHGSLAFSAQDLSKLWCPLFQSSDLSSARASFDDASRQIWDFLPGNWFRKVATEKDLPADTGAKAAVYFNLPSEENATSQKAPGISLELLAPRPPQAEVWLTILAYRRQSTAAAMRVDGYEQKSPLPSTAP